MRLQAPDEGTLEGPMVPGAACADAPVTRADGRPGWLLEQLGGAFAVLRFGAPGEGSIDARGLDNVHPKLRVVHVRERAGACAVGEVLGDPQGLARARYGGAPGVTYLIRPDQHVAARFARYDPNAVRRALARAIHREAA
jgi:3-(3-hydroxy-phenyl)propionate hydroxylase